MKLLLSIIGLSAMVTASSALAQEVSSTQSGKLTEPSPDAAPAPKPSTGYAGAGAPTPAANPAAETYAPGDVQQQLLEAQRQLERAHRELQAKFPRGGFGGYTSRGGGFGIVTAPGMPSANGPLIIRFSEADAKDQAAVAEDLAIMSRILDKSVSTVTGAEMRGAQALGIDLFMQSGATSLRDAYIEGYGVIFVINVNFPLIAPPEKLDEPKTESDSNWEEAKRELYGQPQDAPSPGATVENYSEDKVNKLKYSIYDALKNAKNIRALKPDESVTVCVIGASNGGFSPDVRSNGRKSDGQRRKALADADAAPKTYMTIQVKKSDVTSEDIGKKVRISNYFGAPDPTPGDAALFQSLKR